MPFATHLKFVPGFLSSLITVLLLPIFVYLGSWQYHRMIEKQAIEEKLKKPTPIEWQAHAIETHFARYRYQTVHVQGQFLSGKDILLDNQTFKGQAGYRVFTPFLPMGSNQKILLIDRGWIAAQTRSHVPHLTAIPPSVKLTGVLNQLSQGITLKEEALPNPVDHWPLRLQKIPVEKLNTVLGHEVYPFILQLAENSPYVYTALPVYIGISSLRHLGYAVQWFTMAAAVLIYYLVINIRRQS